ncbi:hypothetical protein [Bifidobacterium phasiani]|uniref:Uncharacterized protein n=1 Tax=Bifidobacterium phasiani TaxID=2834431 RepID=A0ABS6W9C4_9BIFI|nr:hypothetical protein [Bifidobacterium phasiani]MBW3083110.1 hypothetical protein [Bifidobacterium phasiani]
MSEIVLPADITDAFDHLMMVGLAAILEDEPEADRTCSLRWKDMRSAVLSTSDGLDVETVAGAVGRHARRWAQSAWLNFAGDYTTKDDAQRKATQHATLSPRLSGIYEPDGWRRLQRDRWAAIDSLQTVGDRRYVGALGEPSYWSGRSGKELRADYGASRWEMVTRNKGQEFVGGRLLPLSRQVARRSVQQVMEGLTGQTVADEAGNGSPQSRTGTGLHRPMKTDNARAWCALFGVSAFPHLVNTAMCFRDTTAGLTQMTRLRRFAILPVFDMDWTLAKYRSVIRSASLLQFGTALISAGALKGSISHNDSFPQHGVQWLKEKGVISCAVFRQYVSDNPSAPERWLERGLLYPVDAETVQR